MLDLFLGLNTELVAGALVGFTMLGVVIRNAIVGWREARTKLQESESSFKPLATAMAISWDRDQIERALQLLEAISESLEAISKSQGILSDQFQRSTQSKLNDLFEKLEHVHVTPKRR